MTKPWPPRLIAFALWALAALSLSYWLLTYVGMSEHAIAAESVAAEAPMVVASDLARVLGPAAVAPVSTVATVAPAQNPGIKMQLLGVVANRRNIGVALISIEGQPPRPYRVGSQIADAYTLTRVAARSATLSSKQQGEAAITLELASTIANISPLQALLGGSNNLTPTIVPAPRPVLPASTEEPLKD